MRDGLPVELARVLETEWLGLPCHVLARRVHRRKAEVHSALLADSRFEHHGHTHGSRWRLATTMPSGPNGTGPGRNHPAAPELDLSGVPLAGRTAEDALP